MQWEPVPNLRCPLRVHETVEMMASHGRLLAHRLQCAERRLICSG
jgi:hypothetical protein